MIVSGGENVFPDEVEELLSHHSAVADVAVVGVSDDEFGQALAAFVVLHGTARRSPPTRSRPTFATTWHATRCRDRWCSSTSFPRNTTGKVRRASLAERSLPARAS